MHPKSQTQAKSIKVSLQNLDETYKLDYVAKQACGSVWYESKKTIMLAVVTIDDEARQEEFLPLTVQYIHKSYAIGKIPGGFMKREGKPSEFEILTSRLIDRSLRPLFPKGYYYPTQISIFALSYEGESDLQVCALHAAANALLISGLDFIPAVSSVRVGKINNKFVINPSNSQMQDSSLDLYVSGSGKDVLMIEMKGKKQTPKESNTESKIDSSQSNPYIDEDSLLEAIALAQNAIQKDCKQYDKLLKPHKAPTLDLPIKPAIVNESIYELIAKDYKKPVLEAIKAMSKSERSSEIDSIAKQILESKILESKNAGTELDETQTKELKSCIKEMLNLYKKQELRKMVLESNIRADGRGLKDVRQISIETNILPCVHSSALFTRGETQALVTCTLGGENDAQILDDFSGVNASPQPQSTPVKEKFSFHYNFPSFSVGEASMIGGVGRRELGHGNLAKKALESSLPSNRASRNIIRLVSEILESNGSSSMASVCGGAMALRACGIENELVAGVAMGLICDEAQTKSSAKSSKKDSTNNAKKYAILTDIMGLEDHDGDMDFKVAGSKNGINAMQMDIKLGGLDFDILKEALYQAKEAREHILGIMQEACKSIKIQDEILPKSELFAVPSAKIADIIGQGGKTIKEITERFGVSIDIFRDKGEIQINALDSMAISNAKAFILALITPKETYTQGEIFDGIIKSVADFGLFIELPKGGDGLLHISKLPRENTPLKERYSQGQVLKCVVIETFRGKIGLALA
ncbi:polyribonucleotide nucleotidyltransferase [Helicobacter sp. T3_23-1056]